MNSKNTSLRSRIANAATVDEVRALYAESGTYTQATGKWHRRVYRLAHKRIAALANPKKAPVKVEAKPVEAPAPVAEVAPAKAEKKTKTTKAKAAKAAPKSKKASKKAVAA